MQSVDQHISSALNHYASSLEKIWNCDVLAYVGPIYHQVVPRYREVIEALQMKQPSQAGESRNNKKLIIILNTPGGVVEAVEKLVQITRYLYSEVEFFVPDMAMSAGTVWCMSDDKIWMDYASSLGPIDPQVQSSNGTFVPALGYLDKFSEFVNKSEQNKLSTAEIILLQRMDLAELRRHEQARDLSVSLLKQWLVKYKFKSWTHHRTHALGQPVTPEEKEKRAEQIAKDLADNKRWHSHGRMICRDVLINELKIEIDSYENDEEVNGALKIYNTLLVEQAERQGTTFFVHSARS